MADYLIELAQKTRAAAQKLAVLSLAQRNEALEKVALALAANQARIIAANELDCAAAAAEGIAQALYARLKLGESKLQAAIAGIQDLVKLPDPLGHLQIHRELDEGLILKRITCPVGVLGIIFEARPEALIQITSLAIKSGNGVILKGGKEAIQSCTVLTEIIQAALKDTAISPDAVTLLTTREEITTLLSLDKYVDLIIPRGSNSFVQYVQQNTNIPVLGHADGICHLYVDQDADLAKTIPIVVDAKTQYPAACNAIETLLIHEKVAPQFLPKIAAALKANNVVLLGDEVTQDVITVRPATEMDWHTEYSDLILAIKIVRDLDEAIAHINTYGSKHTDGIITENQATAQTFLNDVNSAGVYHNCSTRFADGFRYGFGAEVGISTQTLPPRGPVGLEGLITYKYHLVGNGQIAATYSGAEAKPFTHKDL